MPTAIIDGIATRFEIFGSGPPLLMYSPGGFNATVETWSTLGIYARIRPLTPPCHEIHLHHLRPPGMRANPVVELRV
jgi:hypothetical protein